MDLENKIKKYFIVLIFLIQNFSDYHMTTLILRSQLISEMGGIELRNFRSLARIKCLSECSKELYCHSTLFDFKTHKCSLFSGHSIKPQLLNNHSQVFHKSYQKQNVDSEYFSVKFNAYLPCPKNFKKFNQNPNACYHISGLREKFFPARNYCQNMNSFLPRPKDLIQRQLVESFEDTDPHIWVDSFITSLNEEFKWGDGSSINVTIEINNLGGDSMILEQQALVLKDSNLFDYEEEYNAMVICQII